MHGGRPAGSYRRILGSRLTPGEVRSRFTEATEPAARPAMAGATGEGRGLFSGPTPAERDKLAVALQRRFEQVYPKRAP